MASTYRFYRALRIGDGLSRGTAFRSKLTEYISDDDYKTFWDWINQARPVRFCLAWCEPALHATIAADPDISALSPEFADFATLNAWLDQPVGTLPPALVTRLESDGFPVDWIVGSTTRRQLWRRVMRHHSIIQRLSGLGDRAFDVFKAAIDDTVVSLPVVVRNRTSAWMQERGLDTSWIVGTTTVREVVKFVGENMGGLPDLRLRSEIDFNGNS